MPAGLNLTGRIWRYSANNSDDVIGGANPTGTILYTPVFARIKTLKPTQALLEQGLETPEIFTGVLAPGNMTIHENDEYEVTGPAISDYVNLHFRIIGVQRSSFDDPRKFIIVTMRRMVQANALQ